MELQMSRLCCWVNGPFAYGERKASGLATKSTCRAPQGTSRGDVLRRVKRHSPNETLDVKKRAMLKCIGEEWHETSTGGEKAFLRRMAKNAKIFEIPKNSVPAEWTAELSQLPHVVCATQSPRATANESVVIWLLTGSSSDTYKGALFTTEHAMQLVPQKLTERVPVNIVDQSDFLRLKSMIESEERAILRNVETDSGQENARHRLLRLEEMEVALGIGKPGAFFSALMLEEIAAESGALAVLTSGLAIHPLLAPVVALVSLGELAKDTWFWVTDTGRSEKHREVRIM
mmetsp:Transcript_12808/g.34473  ORF Transcript_12808/g.34473 Transcript_12808/m.34473 type:complete len:288 (+) Transcript_12808:44-907(+)